VDNSVWEPLFAAMPSLESFTFSPGNPKHIGFMDNDAAVFGASLPHSLEEFDVSDYYLDDGHLDVLGSLRELSKLKVLGVQVGILLGSEGCRADSALWEFTASYT
jgi:hypothetical protein